MVAVTADKVVVELEAKLDRYMAEVRASQQQFERSMTGMQRSATHTEATVSRMARGLVASFGAISAGMVLRTAVKDANDFDESLTKIVTLVGVNADQVAAWREELLRLGPALGKSPAELANGLFFITSAGLRGKEALDALVASAKGSAVGLGDTAVVADAATSAVNAYGAANLSAEKAVATLMMAVREGKAEASAIAPVLGQIVPIASKMSVGFDEVSASIAAMTRLGAPAAESATSLQSILTTIAKGGTHEADVALGQLSLSFADLRKSLREHGLLDTLLMLQKRIGDDDEALTKIFPNVRALRGLLNLLGNNVEEVRGIFKRMGLTVPTDLEDAFGTTSQSTAHKYKEAVAGINTELTRLGSDLAPTAAAGLKLVADAMHQLTDNPKLAQGIAAMALAYKLAGPGGAMFVGAAYALYNTVIPTSTAADDQPYTNEQLRQFQKTGSPQQRARARAQLSLGLQLQQPQSMRDADIFYRTDLGKGTTNGKGGGGAVDPEALKKWDQAILKFGQARDALIEEAKALDLSSYEAEKNAAALHLRQVAEQAGLAITPKMKEKIDELSESYARNTIALREQQKLHELAFERSQIGRSPTEQTVASSLRDLYGADWQSHQDEAIAAQIRLNEQIKAGQQAWQSFGNDAWDALQSIFDGSKSAKDAVLDLIKQLLLAEAKAQFLNAIGAGNGQQGPLSAIFGLFGLGGGSGSVGAPMNILPPGMANGGVATTPSMISEFGQPEAAVPLPDGRSIPVSIRMPQAPTPAASGALSVSLNTSVDARGSNMTEAQFNAILDKRDQKLMGQIVPTVRQAQSRRFL